MYGLAAAKVRRSADGLTYQFFIRPEATFHDGTRLTAHDVAFSLNLLKEKGHPLITQSLRDFVGATADDDVTVVANFRAEPRARCAAARRRAADLLARLLRDEAVRRIDARRSTRLRRLQSRPLRSRPLYRIRARQGLVGRRVAGRPRPEQFRHRALRILPRPRPSVSKALLPRITSSARSLPRAPGRRATTFPPSGTDASRRMCCPTTRRPVRKAGSSIRGGRNSPIRGCARRCATPSTLNGPTRPSCIRRTTAPSRCSRIPT